ncbi:hypothetical protein METBIDRAFT_205754 [Metschnikowia bicuspidata var. bicuspidata NRRL YB-4993]|uniref:Uncharacterized protein n=1 Tax=Metschnikowia bicuspidata var. bicuspidata NRRL YB-4993 TaxID=869754 RepID=A0A1A0H9H7_9ASCO|nr:hypothetical protein METBIDRAFT_205754 [Metschnikowia bicuspidata var. bicuspidata NRRL YB-4993]OBA20779.1 hypothetical protein METBIDRAFT_205754 [Metschnikowia bicuspidata var. bicuspidata NRRL YB-4993]
MFVLAVAAAFSAWLLFQTPAPTSQVQQARLLRDFVLANFSVAQPVHVDFGDRGFRFPDLVEAAQRQLDFRLAADGIPYRYPLRDRLPKVVPRPETELEAALARPPLLTDEGDGPSGGGGPSTAEDPVGAGSNVGEWTSVLGGSRDGDARGNSRDLEPSTLANPRHLEPSTLGRGLSNTSAAAPQTRVPEYSVEIYFQDLPRLSLDLVQLKAYMAYSLDFIHQNDLPFFLTQAIYDTLLQPDLDMRRQMLAGRCRLQDVTRHLNINFVAAEELGETRPEISAAILQHMRQFEAILAYVKIVPSVHVLNVLKHRATAGLLHNSSSELSFFYLTTMRPYANSVQNVPLRHLDPLAKEPLSEGNVYGTEYQRRLRLSQTDTYNITSFLEDATRAIKQAIRLPRDCSNLRLVAESVMKHYILGGLVEMLDLLIAQEPFDTRAYMHILRIVDDILLEETHDWASRLTEVMALHDKLKV